MSTEEVGSSSSCADSVSGTPKTRKGRKHRSMELYRADRSSGPYRLSRDLNKYFCEQTSKSGAKIEGVCIRCAPALMHYKKEFNQVNPRSKRPTTSQNEWLRDCFFDAMGNYLFCSNVTEFEKTTHFAQYTILSNGPK